MQPGVRVMTSIRLLSFALLIGIGAAGSASNAMAQAGPGGLVSPQRDCQTIVNCQFTKGGSYRGCISSYSCRVCRFVAARCTPGLAGRVCTKVRCTWGA